MEIREIIKARRLKEGFTLRGFCEKMGTDPGNWSKTERGIIPLQTHHLSDACFVLGMKTGDEDFDLITIRQKEFDCYELMSFVNWYLGIKKIDKRHELENLSIISEFLNKN